MSDKIILTLADFLAEEKRSAEERSRRIAEEVITPANLREVKQQILREQAMEALKKRDLKAAEAALLMDIHVNTLKRMLKRGILPGYRIGTRGDWRISRDAIDMFKNRGGSW